MIDETQAGIAEAATTPADTTEAPPSGRQSLMGQDTAPGQDVSAEPEASESQSASTVDESSFKIPDDYKEKGWAKNLKSEADVWKMLDNAQALAGKKSVVPDLDKATEAEVEAYYSQLRPADKSAYQFDDGLQDEQKEAFAEMFYKNGISAKQGNALVQQYNALQQAAMQKHYDADSFVDSLKQSFGEKYEPIAKEAAKTMSAHLNEEDRLALENIPNQYLGLLYRLTANINKTHGIQEGGAVSAKPSAIGAVDVESQRASLRTQIYELNSRPHTAEERMALNNKLAATYTGE